MDKRLRNALVLLAAISLGAWIARTYGWYNGYWFTDVILHLASGVMFAYVWGFIVRKERFHSKFVYILGAVSFAAFGSVLWEVWEFYGHLLRPDVTVYYVPELGDSLQDILCGSVGSLIGAVWARMK
jgi:hypothetical protein